MSDDSLEDKCRNAVLKIADHVRSIDFKLSHFLDNYRDDYYDALDGISYQKALKSYQK